MLAITRLAPGMVAILALLSIGFLSGCGGGDASPSPSPSPSSLPTITAESTALDGPIRAIIRWQPAPDIPIDNVIEYHIYRDGIIVGTAQVADSPYYDGVWLNGTNITYQSTDGTALETRTMLREKFMQFPTYTYGVSVLARLASGQYIEKSLGTPVRVGIPTY